MARSLEQILIIDVESTCWDGAPPPGQVSDIIEIGVCVLDVKSLERSGKRSILCRPERSEVSAFCTGLTTLRPEDCAAAGRLAEGCEVLRRELHSRDRPWASYGDYDRRQFERCCAELDVAYPFGPSHLNIKSLFGLSVGLGREVGMAGALARLGRPLEGTHHRGHDDAWNIAGILGDLLRRTRSVP